MFNDHWTLISAVKPRVTPSVTQPVPPERVTPLPLQPPHPRISLPPVHAFGADARCIPCKVLKNAIRAVLSHWGKRPRSTGPDEVAELLGVVATAIHQAWFSDERG